MAAPVFGIQLRRIDEEGRPAIAADLSTIGLIGPAPAANEDVFPLNFPFRVDSNRTAILTQLGEEGYLSDAVRGINDQLAVTQFAARIVVVRTPQGDDPDPAVAMQQTINNICGDSIEKTGLWAFTRSAQIFGFTPRLIVAPGYTGQMANWIGDITQVSGAAGSGYEEGVDYALNFSSNTDEDPLVLHARAHAKGKRDGTLGPAVIDFPGSWYTQAPMITVEAPPASDGVVAEYTATIANGANPVCAALTPVLNQLMGHAIVESSGQSQQNDDDWRETMQSERIIPLSGGLRVQDRETSFIVVRPFAPRFAGIMVRRDHETGAPFHSGANQPVQGIIGPNRDIPFAITDDANEGQELLAHNIGVLLRGQVGDDFAIASGGFVAVATDNCGEDELWRMYNITRGRDFIHLTFIRALRFYLGRYNITIHTVNMIMQTMVGVLRDLKADGHIIDYKMLFRPDGNSSDEIRLGHLSVGFLAEEPPVLKRITIESGRYRAAIDAMVADLAAQLNLAA